MNNMCPLLFCSSTNHVSFTTDSLASNFSVNLPIVKIGLIVSLIFYFLISLLK